MQIVRLSLEGFGCFAGAEFEFRPAEPNYVVGGSDSVRRDLLSAVPALLFGLDAPEAFQPRSGRPYRGSMDLLIDNARYRITRDFARRYVTLSRSATGPATILHEGTYAPAGGRGLETISPHLSMITPDVFRDLCMIARQDLAEHNGRGLGFLIRSVAAHAAAPALRRLNDEIASLDARPPWTDEAAALPATHIEQLRARLADLLQRKGRLEQALEDDDMLDRLSGRLEGDIRSLQEERERTQRLHDAARTLASLLARRSEAEKRGQEIAAEEKRARALHEELEKHDAELAAADQEWRAPLDVVEERMRALRECTVSLAWIETLTASREARARDIAQKLAQAEKGLAARFRGLTSVPEGLLERVRFLAVNREELARKTARVQALQAEAAALQARLATDFPRLPSMLEFTPGDLEEVVVLGRELAAMEPELARRRQIRRTADKRLADARRLLAVFPPAFRELPADFPVNLSMYLEKKKALEALSLRIAEEKRAHSPAARLDPIPLAAGAGAGAGILGAAAGWLLGGVSTAASLATALAGAAVAAVFVATREDVRRTTLARGAIAGLAKQHADLAAEIAKLKPALRGFENQGFVQACRVLRKRQEAEAAAAAEIGATGDLEPFEFEVAQLRERLAALGGRPAAAAASSTGTDAGTDAGADRAGELAGTMRALDVHGAQIAELLESETDPKTGRPSTALDRLQRRVDTETAALGPFAKHPADQLETALKEYRKRTSDITRMRDLLNELGSQEDPDTKPIRLEIETLKAAVAPIAAGRSLEDAEKMLAGARRAQRRTDELRAVLCANRPLTEIRAALEEAGAEVGRREREIELLLDDYPELKKAAVDGRAASEMESQLEEKLNALASEGARKEARRREAVGAPSAPQTPPGNIENMVEEIRFLQGRVSRAERRGDALRLAARELDQSEEQHRAALLDRVLACSAALWRTVAAGGRDAGWNPAPALARLLGTAGAAEPIAGGTAEDPYGGRRGSLYLCGRVALCRESAGALMLPVFIHDAFDGADPARLGALTAALKALSAEHQLFLFTSDRRFAEGANAAINLDAWVQTAAQ